MKHITIQKVPADVIDPSATVPSIYHQEMVNAYQAFWVDVFEGKGWEVETSYDYNGKGFYCNNGDDDTEHATEIYNLFSFWDNWNCPTYVA